ncbi:MAG TPA: FAD-dependent oxidoreductase [Candidatus Acidoferrum sp.]|nr:FAD-dependent oxidoreductase [Candidatus Acidoferrum sp.]
MGIARQLRSWGYAAEWITLRQVRELEPDIDPATIGDAPVAFFPEEGWLDPVVYAHAMLSAARLRYGAKVLCGARVVDLIMAGDRVTGVRVADGTQYEADIVVNCAGRWTNEVTRRCRKRSASAMMREYRPMAAPFVERGRAHPADHVPRPAPRIKSVG